MKLYICTNHPTRKSHRGGGGGGAKIRTAIFFISCCNIAPHLWLSFLKTILVVVTRLCIEGSREAFDSSSMPRGGGTLV